MNEIRDILLESVEQLGFVEKLSPLHVCVSLGVAAFCAIIIYLLYRFFYRGAVYSENFNILIVLTTLTTAFIIMTISSNLVLSLGMVGALSIVRFRAAVKDPLDIGFLFLGISAGLTAGAGLYPVALIGTLGISLIYILFYFIGTAPTAFLLIVKYDDIADEDVNIYLDDYKKKLKNKTKYANETELTYSLKLHDDDTQVVNDLLKIDGVKNALLVSYTGENQY